jgi:hypothetical protein
MLKESKTSVPADLSLRGRNIKGQVIGAILGAFVAFALIRVVGRGLSLENQNLFLLVGATIGSLLFDLKRLEKAGSYLTRRTNTSDRMTTALNVGVAILGMLVMVGMVTGLSYLVLLILGK